MNKDTLYLEFSATYWFAIQAKRPLKKEEKWFIIKKYKGKKKFKHSIIRHALKETTLMYRTFFGYDSMIYLILPPCNPVGRFHRVRGIKQFAECEGA